MEQVARSRNAKYVVGILENGVLVVLVVWRTVIFPAQTVIEGQVGSYAPAIRGEDTHLKLPDAVRDGNACLIGAVRGIEGHRRIERRHITDQRGVQRFGVRQLSV